MHVNKDANLKAAVKQIIENFHLDDAIIDREVQLNFSGTRDANGNLVSDTDVDVIVRFSYSGSTILLLFECEDVEKAREVRKTYGQHRQDAEQIKTNPTSVSVLGSADDKFRKRHFQNIDEIRSCFVYGDRLLEFSYQHCTKEATRLGFFVWNHQAIVYYTNRLLKKEPRW